MAVYTVQSNVVDSFAGMSASAAKVATYSKGQEINITSIQGKYGQVANRNEYILLVYLKRGSESNTSSEDDLAINTAENNDKATDSTITGHTDSDYNKLLLRYIRAFGAPPRFSEQVDPYYSTDTEGIYVGRVMASTWFSNPSIMSICPGTVDYLPGFNSKDKDKFFTEIQKKMSPGEVMDRLVDGNKKSKDGQLYAFKSRYNEYINVVNGMARACALFLGIGDVTDIIHGTNIPLKNFDYGYFTTPSDAAMTKSFFSTAAASLSTAVSDSSYVHFFVNRNGGSKMTEQISTESGKSYFESLIDDQSGISSLSQNLQFLFGGSLSAEAESDIGNLISSVSDHNQFLGGLTTIASNYLKGGRLVFPQMITGMRYNKSINCELQFTSLYGDKRSIFKYVILPALHLLAMATPIQLSGNMYTYPFLIRCYQRGVANCDLAFIQNLQLSRGGNDDSSWTVDGLPTEITASFEITPLYSNLMVSSVRNPWTYLQNTSLMEYLGNMCGVDLKANNIHVKIDLAMNLLYNSFADIPTNVARGISDLKIVNEIKKFTQIIN